MWIATVSSKIRILTLSVSMLAVQLREEISDKRRFHLRVLDDDQSTLQLISLKVLRRSLCFSWNRS